MGNTFTYYYGNKQFNVSSDDDNGLYAFAIYNSNLSLSDITVNSNWNSFQYQTGSTYTLLFRYEPNDIPTVKVFTDGLVFTSNSTDINTDLTIDNVIDTSNSGVVSNPEVFNNPYNTTTLQTNNGSGGGDPHIIPLYNPYNKVYLLPTDDKCYRYFDTNRSEDMRIIINARMWIISNSYIARLEKLLKNGLYKEYHRQRMNIEFPDTITPYETSFMRYLDIYGIKENKIYKITIDMETLDFEGFIPNVNISKLNITKKSFKYPNTKYIPPNPEFDKYRLMTIKTDNYDIIKFKLYLTPLRPNHRNHIEILSNHVRNIIQNCFGCLVSIHHISSCNDIEYPEDCDIIHNCRTIQDYKRKIRKYNRLQLRKIRREQRKLNK